MRASATLFCNHSLGPALVAHRPCFHQPLRALHAITHVPNGTRNSSKETAVFRSAPAATLINAPNKEQYLISANHCLGQTNTADTEVFWGVLFDYYSQCDTDGGAAAAQVPQYQLLQVRACPYGVKEAFS
jgi:hypothetical protein